MKPRPGSERRHPVSLLALEPRRLPSAPPAWTATGSEPNPGDHTAGSPVGSPSPGVKGQPTLSIADARTVESIPFQQYQEAFTVTLSAPSAQTVTVNYATADGTAQAPFGYLTTSGTLTFDPGVVSQTISVRLDVPQFYSETLTFSVSLSGASGAGIARGTATGTIVADYLPFGFGLARSDVAIDRGPNDTIRRMPHLDGNAPAGSTVQLIDRSGNVLGTTTARPDGTFTVQPDKPLPLGNEALEAVADGRGTETGFNLLSAPAPGSYFGNGAIDPVIFQPSTSTFVFHSTASNPTAQFGQGTLYGGDPIPVSGAYTGLAEDQLAVFQPSTSTFSIQGLGAIQFGQGTLYGGDPIPVAADFDGDGLTDIAVFQPSTSTFYIRPSDPRQQPYAVQFGQGTLYGGDPIPVAADYTGSGMAQPAVYQPSTSTFYIQGVGAVQFGQGTQDYDPSTGLFGDPIPVPADFAFKGHVQIAVFQPATSTFDIQGQGAVQFGQGTLYGGDPIPIASNSFLAVYQPSTATAFIRGVGTETYGPEVNAGGGAPIPLPPVPSPPRPPDVTAGAVGHAEPAPAPGIAAIGAVSGAVGATSLDTADVSTILLPPPSGGRGHRASGPETAWDIALDQLSSTGS